MSEAPVDVCAQCGARAERLLSAGAGLIFKGSGFYITDYRGDSYKKAAESDKAASGTTSSSESSAPAEKPAAKPADTGSKKKSSGSTE